MLGVWVGVSVMVGVLVGGVLVWVGVLLLVDVRDGVYEEVNEAVAVRGVPVFVEVLEGIKVLLGVRVRVGLGPGVLVNVFDDVLMEVNVLVDVRVTPEVAVDVTEGVSETVGSVVRVRVGSAIRVGIVAVRVPSTPLRDDIGKVGVTSGTPLGSCSSSRLPMYTVVTSFSVFSTIFPSPS